jgi:hypothetical protein
MKTHTHLVVTLLAVGCIGFAGGAALTHAAQAAGPDATCTSNTPCLTESNTSTGAGVKGTSELGIGVLGTTKSTSGDAGVVGRDLQLNAGSGNSGVTGVSKSSTGVLGVGATFGIVGETNGTVSGVSILAKSPNPNTILFEGIGSKGIFVVKDDGSVSANTASFSCFCSQGVFGQGSEGAVGFGTSVGLLGLVSTANGIGVQSDDIEPTDLLFAGFGSQSGNNKVFYVTDAGDVFAHSYNTGVAANVLQRTSTGQTVKTFSNQSAVPTLEDFGRAQLINGVANVRLERTFASAIDRNATYMVMLTPEGDCRGLYVAQQTSTDFTIRELQGGRSTISFNYRIVAKPYDSTPSRLPSAAKELADAARIGSPRIRVPQPPNGMELTPGLRATLPKIPSP